MSQKVLVEAELDASKLEAGAKQAQQAINKVADSAEVAGKDLKRMGDSSKQAGDAIGKTGGSAAKMAGALSLVSPAAADGARGLADLADVGEVAAEASAALGLSLAPVAVVLGAVALAAGIGAIAWKAYHFEEEQAKKKSDELTASLKQLQPINTMATDTALELAHAQGKLTDTEYALKRGIMAASKARNDSIAEAKERIAVLQEEMGSEEDARLSNGLLNSTYTAQKEELEGLLQVVSAADRAYEDTVTNLQGLKDATDRKTASDEAALEAAQELAKSEKERKDLIAGLQKEIEAEAKAEKERLSESLDGLSTVVAAYRAYGGVIHSLDDEIVQQQVNTLEGIARIEGERDLALHNLEDRLDAELEKYEYSEARKAEISARYAELRALTEQQYNEQTAQMRQQLSMDSLSALRVGLEGAATLFKDSFEVQKTLAVSIAIIDGILAAQKALASAPPPFNFIAAAGVGLATTANVVAISSETPKFHTGTDRVDEVNATLQTGEAVLSRRGVAELGRDAVRAANSGRTMGRERAAPIIYRHKVFNEFVRDNLKIGGPLAAGIRGSQTVGYRTREG